jgi:branched-chain amino acid aminotransferase
VGSERQFGCISCNNTMLQRFGRFNATATLAARASFSTLACIDVNKLVIKRTTTPKAKVPHTKLVFGHTFTDHMLEIDWDAAKGWSNPVISPYHPLQLDPAVSSLHYALQAFEGLKAYLDKDGNIRLFRPDKNMKRLNNSCSRLCFPVIWARRFVFPYVC